MTDGRKLQIGFAFALLMTAFVVWLGLQEATSQRSSTGVGNPAPVPGTQPALPAHLPSDPLALAQAAFVGNHSRDQIKLRLDRALTLYGMPITDDNYSRAASSLVALRRENGVAEMAVLDYMIRSHVPGVAISFPQGAAMASVFLAAGDK